MQGRRLPDGTERFARGDYGKLFGTDGAAHWHACTPAGSLGNLDGHTVTEHEDGTITVSPSILVTAHDGDEKIVWHGFLERGVWREV
jgi:hypothetical protein